MEKYNVTEATFIASAPTLSACPPSIGPEIAFAGRSNVGKSSLLNFLAGRNKLARVSSTPGRTRLLNFFRVTLTSGHALGLVDLPGYGFAKISKEERRSFGPMLNTFLFGRQSLKALALLLDLRRDPCEEDAQVVALAKEMGLGLVVLATKSDELSKSKRFPQAMALAKALGLPRQPVLTSVNQSFGRDDSWRAVLSALFPPAAALAKPAEIAAEPAEPVEPVIKDS